MYSDFRVIASHDAGLDLVLFRGDPQECIEFLCELAEPELGWQFSIGYTEHSEV